MADLALKSTVKQKLAPALPLLRAVKWGGAYKVGRIHAACPAPRPPTRSLAFIIGCGRSGTTILGDILGRHPDVDYLFEPFHLWAAVDPATDATGIYARHADAHCILGAVDCSPQTHRGFERVFLRHGGKHAPKLLMEKSPINCLRIGYLRALAPEARFVHIVRNGVDVAHSISNLARTGVYRIGGRYPYNQWWGVADKKWPILCRDAIVHGYLDEDLSELTDSPVRGALEWIVSVEHVERWRPVLGPSIIDIHYEDLLAEPDRELRLIASYLDLAPHPDWLVESSSLIRAPSTGPGQALDLPASLAPRFQSLMERYGYGPDEPR
jgi:Sulfotransferase family